MSLLLTIINEVAVPSERPPVVKLNVQDPDHAKPKERASVKGDNFNMLWMYMQRVGAILASANFSFLHNIEGLGCRDRDLEWKVTCRIFERKLSQ